MEIKTLPELDHIKGNTQPGLEFKDSTTVAKEIDLPEDNISSSDKKTIDQPLISANTDRELPIPSTIDKKELELAESSIMKVSEDKKPKEDTQKNLETENKELDIKEKVNEEKKSIEEESQVNENQSAKVSSKNLDPIPESQTETPTSKETEKKAQEKPETIEDKTKKMLEMEILEFSLQLNLFIIMGKPLKEITSFFFL